MSTASPVKHFIASHRCNSKVNGTHTHTCASVTERCDLVLAEERWSSASW